MNSKFNQIPHEKLVEIIKSSPSMEQICTKLGLSNGPHSRKKIKGFINQNNLDISHFDRSWKAKASKRHFDKMENCLCCGKEFISTSSSKGRVKTCSWKCSNIFFSEKRMTPQTKLKISDSLNVYNESLGKFGLKYRINNDIQSTCDHCGKKFFSKSNKTKTCSRKCQTAIRNTPEYRQKLADIQNARVEAGTHKGWTTRNIASYPEKYFQFRLEELKIEYNFNHPISKKELGLKGANCYFLDFYFPNKKIDLEIDGKQHLRDDRLKSDLKRDEALKSIGIKVFRIAWKNPINIKNKKYLDDKIDEFLVLYNQ